MTPILFGCVGTGGTGKTSVVSELVKIHPDVTMVSSIVRPTMKQMGLENEDAMKALSAEERMEVQLHLLDAFEANKQRAIDESHTRFLVFERTALDHYGYCLFHGQPAMTRERYECLREKMQNSMLGFHTLFYFPYPVPWTVQYDGFRTLGQLGQNVLHDAVLHSEMQRLTTLRSDQTWQEHILLLDFDMDARLSTINAILDEYRDGTLPHRVFI